MEEAEVPMSELVESGEDVSVVVDLADEALHKMTLSVALYKKWACSQQVRVPHNKCVI